MYVLNDDVPGVSVLQDATRRRNEYSLSVLGVVEPDTVLVVQRTGRPATVQLKPIKLSASTQLRQVALVNAENPLDTFPCNFPVDGEVVNLLRTC